MKNRVVLVLLLGLVLIEYSSGQTLRNCFLDDLDNASGARGTAPGLGVFRGNALDRFVPGTNDPNDTINLNLVFFEPVSGNGIYDTVTMPSISLLINDLNEHYAKLSPPNLTTRPTHFIPDSKLRFNLKSVSFVKDDVAYYYSLKQPVKNVSSYLDSNAINIFFQVDTTVNTGGLAFDYGSIGLYICLPPATWNPNINTISRTLAHEIGHCLGLLHSFDNPVPSQATLKALPLINDLANAKENLRYLVPEPCHSVPNDSASNNVMGYNVLCRSYFSPQQIAKMHFKLSTVPLLTKTLKTKMIDYCAIDHSADSLFQTSQTWITARAFPGNIIIDSAVHIIVKCEVALRKNAKVIVKRGGKLTINGGVFMTLCNGQWEGIEVWGNNKKSQALDNNNMPLYQGMVEMINGTIKDARYGVSLIRKDSLGNPDPASSGGIIQASDSSVFHNNYIGVDMYPYNFVNGNPLSNQNFNFFKETYFTLSQITLSGALPAFAGVRLQGIKNIRFEGCSFNFFGVSATCKGIYGLDASVIVKDLCKRNPEGSCSKIRNRFTYGSYGIYLANSVSFSPSYIDNAYFERNNNGGIYISNSAYSQITNCHLKVSIKPPQYGAPRYGIYLDNCTGYIIEHDSLFSFPPLQSIGNVGIYVNNSGPYANNISNCAFVALQQGICAQNQNVDWSTGAGLRMNCNSFTRCKSSVGVQKGMRYYLGNPDLTGVDQVQRMPLLDSLSLSCPDNYFPSFSEQRLDQTITQQRENIIKYQDSLRIEVDGGQTEDLLKTIHDQTIKTTVLEEMLAHIGPYLSDTVLIAFYSSASPTDHNAYIHKLNAPVTQKVMTALANIGLPYQVMSMITYQQNAEMKGRRLLEAKINLVHTELGLLLNERMRRFVTDSIDQNAGKSILEVLQHNERVFDSVNWITYYMSTGAFSEAEKLVMNIEATGGFVNYIALQKILLNVKRFPDNALTTIGAAMNDLVKMANSSDPMLEGTAKALLKYISVETAEECLAPDGSNSWRQNDPLPVGREFQIRGGLVNIYPNPANRFLYLEMENVSTVLIAIRDITGKILMSKIIEGKGSIDINSLNNGVYFVDIKGSDSVTETKKIVVIK